MMTVDEALRAHLLADDQIKAIIGQNIFTSLNPDANTIPAIVFMLTSTDEDWALDGPYMFHAHFEIVALSKTWAQCRALIERCNEILPPNTTMLGGAVPIDSIDAGNIRDMGRDDAQNLYRFDLDVEVIYTN